MPTAPCIYEITFDVPGQRRDQYYSWLETDAVDWFAHESVEEFEVYHNDQGLSPGVKFVFRFDSLRAWATFVGSDEHATATEALETFTERLDGQLWQRDSLCLDCGPEIDGGSPGDGAAEPQCQGQTP